MRWSKEHWEWFAFRLKKGKSSEKLSKKYKLLSKKLIFLEQFARITRKSLTTLWLVTVTGAICSRLLFFKEQQEPVAQGRSMSDFKVTITTCFQLHTYLTMLFLPQMGVADKAQIKKGRKPYRECVTRFSTCSFFSWFEPIWKSILCHSTLVFPGHSLDEAIYSITKKE